jgi:hypothetical protein
MTEIRVERTDRDITNRLRMAAEACNGLVVDDVGEEYVAVKSSMRHLVYSWGFKIRADVEVIHKEEVEVRFEESRRVPINLTSNPKKYKFQWINALMSDDELEIEVPVDTDSNHSDTKTGEKRSLLSKSQVMALSQKAGSQAKLVTKYILDDFVDASTVEIELQEQNTYIRLTGDGLEELKTEIEDVFGQEKVSIEYTNDGGIEIEVPE